MSHLNGPLDIGQIAVGCALGYLDFRHADRGWREGRPALAALGQGLRGPSLDAGHAAAFRLSMTLPLTQFVTVWGFLAVNIASPGPNVLNTIATAMGSGRIAGLGSAAAVGFGVALWCLGMTLGLAAVFAALPVAQTALTLLAAGLLAWFSSRYLRAAWAGMRGRPALPGGQPGLASRAFSPIAFGQRAQSQGADELACDSHLLSGGRGRPGRHRAAVPGGERHRRRPSHDLRACLLHPARGAALPAGCGCCRALRGCSLPPSRCDSSRKSWCVGLRPRKSRRIRGKTFQLRRSAPLCPLDDRARAH